MKKSFESKAKFMQISLRDSPRVSSDLPRVLSLSGGKSSSIAEEELEDKQTDRQTSGKSGESAGVELIELFVCLLLLIKWDYCYC